MQRLGDEGEPLRRACEIRGRAIQALTRMAPWACDSWIRRLGYTLGRIRRLGGALVEGSRDRAERWCELQRATKSTSLIQPGAVVEGLGHW